MRNVRIPTAQPNVTLSATLFLPAGAGRVPALVAIYPYLKDAGIGIQHDADLRWFAARGYACLLVDFRGIGSSDGIQRPPFDADEADDGVAAVEWAAAQNWCTGKVGIWGMSYGSIMALRTAAKTPPHLKAILAIEGTNDPERDFIHPEGNAGSMGMAMWGGHMLFQQLLPPFEDYGTAAQTARWLRRQNEVEPWLLDLFRQGPGDPVWRSRTFDTSKISIPSFCVAGWRDLFRDGAIRSYERIAAPKKLLVGPWMHSLPHLSAVDAIDFNRLALEWWDHWLRDVDNGVMSAPPVTLGFQGDPTTWLQFESWPPSGDLVLLQANANCALEAADDRRELNIPFQSSPTTGALSGLCGLPTAGFGLPLDQHQDDLKGLLFSSEPQEEDILIAGRPLAIVRMAGDFLPERLVIHLTDVDPEGRSKLIAMGTLSDMAPASSHQVDLGAIGYRLPAGHQLRIVLSDSDFPRLRPVAVAAEAVLESLILELPVTVPNAGVETKVSAPAPGDGSVALVHSAEPKWTIKRDLIADGVEVALGMRMTALTPNREHRMEISQETVARVVSAEPAAAVIHGTYSGTMHMKNGEVVKITANVHTTANSLHAHGEIDIDGNRIFSRRWSA
ncbi:MAG: CocE/NonD family hydrolase [Sphingomonadaceae bacterium]